jgi:hypothetical protein
MNCISPRISSYNNESYTRIEVRRNLEWFAESQESRLVYRMDESCVLCLLYWSSSNWTTWASQVICEMEHAIKCEQSMWKY